VTFKGPFQHKQFYDAMVVECSAVNDTEIEAFIQSRSQAPCYGQR